MNAQPPPPPPEAEVENLAAKLGIDLSFNKRRLGQELANAFVEDATYRAQDEMKKKAILCSRDYQEFKNFVACAEQKCVTSKEMTQWHESLKFAKKKYNTVASGASGAAQPSWRTLATKKKKKKKKKKKNPAGKNKMAGDGAAGNDDEKDDDADDVDDGGLSKLRSAGIEPPKRAADYERGWRRCRTNAERYRLWISTPIALLEGMYQTEIDSIHLGSVLDAVAAAFDPADAGRVLESFEVVARSERFGLTLGFMNDEDRTRAAQVCEKLSAALDGDDDRARITALRTAFGL
jgi:hypothetical protein